MRYIVFILLFITYGCTAQNINQLVPGTAAGQVPMTMSPYFRQAYVSPQTLADTLIPYLSISSGADSLGTAFPQYSIIVGDDTRSGTTYTGLDYYQPFSQFRSPGNFRAGDGLTSGYGFFTANTSLLGYDRTAAGTSSISFYSDIGTGVDGSITKESGTSSALNINNLGVLNLQQAGNTGITIFDVGQVNMPNLPLGTQDSIITIAANGDLYQSLYPDGSETSVTAGSNVSVTGTGTSGDPYVVNSTASGADKLGTAFDTGQMIYGDGTPDGQSSPSFTVSDGTTDGISITSQSGVSGDSYVEYRNSADNADTWRVQRVASGNFAIGYSSPYTFTPTTVPFVMEAGTSTNMLRVDNSGVGINEPNPTATLHVDGTVKFEDYGSARDDGTPSALYGPDGGGNLQVYPLTDVVPDGIKSKWTDAGTYTYLTQTTDNVAIGSASDPARTLKVTGDFEVVSHSYFGASGNHNFNGTAYFNAGIGDYAAVTHAGNDYVLGSNPGPEARWKQITAGAGVSILGSAGTIQITNIGDISNTNEIQNIGYTQATRAMTISSGTGFTFPIMTSSLPGLTPAGDGAGTDEFLREDGTWAVPGGGIYGGNGTVGGGSSVTASVNSGTSFDVNYNLGVGGFGVSSATAFMYHGNGVKIGDADALSDELLIDGFTGGSRIRNENTTVDSRIALYGTGSIEVVAEHGTNTADLTLTAEDEIAITGGATGGNVTIGSGGTTTINDNALIGSSASHQLEILSGGSLLGFGHSDFTQTASPSLGSQLVIYGNVGGGADGDVYLNARGETTSDLNINASQNLGLLAGSGGSGAITTTGNFGINGTPGAYALYVNGNQFSTSASTFTTSDRKVKKNIKSIKDPFAHLMQLNPVSYEYKKDYLVKTNQDKKTMKGFIAQDYQQVFPEDVVDNEGTLAMDSQALIPYLVAAVQELKKENEELKKQIQQIRDEK